MRILDELRYLKELFVKNARRLLHLLSKAACTAHADITKLLHKYYTLLFADAPTRVHQKMVDFNRWLTEVLEDTHTEGITWEPTYSENPWLALEQQPQDSLDEAFTVDNANTIQLLRTACEFYMVRCEGLQQTNAGLATQLEELKIQLKEALVRAFDTQQALDREREVSALQARRLVMGVQIGDHLSQQNLHDGSPVGLHQQITNAFRMLDVVSVDPRESAQDIEATSVNNSERDSNELDVKGAHIDDCSVPEGTEDAEGVSVDQEESHLCLVTEDNKVLPERQEAFQSSQGQTESGRVSSSVFVVESIPNYDDSDYRQLTQLRASEEKCGSWYQYALRTLKEKREQRRLLRKTTVKPPVASLMNTCTAGAACEQSPSLEAQEFVQLVAKRDPVENGEDLTWYRRALQHLKEERKRRESFRDRESISSTISTVD